MDEEANQAFLNDHHDEPPAQSDDHGDGLHGSSNCLNSFFSKIIGSMTEFCKYFANLVTGLINKIIRVLCCMMPCLIVVAIIFVLSAILAVSVENTTTIEATVVAANLRQFDLNNINTAGNTTTLNYNLSLSVAIKNPNWGTIIYYEKLDAMASYKEKKFSWLRLLEFSQGGGDTTKLPLNFHGQSVVILLNESDVSEFNIEKSTGIYNIDIKLYGSMTLQIGLRYFVPCKNEIKCKLRIPLSTNGTLAQGFESTNCNTTIIY